MRLFVIIVVVMFALTGGVDAQEVSGGPPDRTIDAETRRQVIDLALSNLKRDYILPDVAEKMASAIRRRQQNKEYDGITSGRKFAETLTAHLQEISRDKHLEVEFSDLPRPERPPGKPTRAEREGRDAFLRAVNHGFDKVERMNGNIGYLGIRNFAPVALAGDKATAAMNFLTDTDALIVDLRYNNGGDPKMVQFLISYLFGDESVHLNTMHFRSTDITQQFWTLPHVPGKKYLDKPVYVLTNGLTRSGAEGYAYALQNLKRATIIGETTNGAANPGGTVWLHPHFGMFLPTGRAISPITKTSWEGVGVTPDVLVLADHAYKQAYLLALRDIQRRGKYAGPEPLNELVKEAERDLEAAKSGK